MGLFSSKTRVTVATTVSRVVEDKMLPNSVKTGLIRGLIQGGDQLVENVMDSLMSSVAIKAEQMYRWAEKNYVHGLPNVTILNDAPDDQIIESVISTAIGKPITLEYVRYGCLNTLHYAWDKLVSTYAYDQLSNQIGTLTQSKGTPVYLVNLQAVIPETLLSEIESGALEQWGPPPTGGYTPIRAQLPFLNDILLPWSGRMAYLIDPAATQEAFIITYGWMNGAVYTEESIRVPINISQEEQNKGHFQVKYYFEETNQYGYKDKRFRYFTYQDGKGTYPTLDALYSTEFQDLGSFFPMAYFRLNASNQAADKSTPEYKSTKKMLKYLSMDYQGMADAINSNPDIGQVEQAILTMAVPANTTEEVERKYLFDFFRDVYLKTGGIPYGVEDGLAYAGTYMFNNNIPQTSLVIEDRKFRMTLSYQSIHSFQRVGSIAAVGKHVSGMLTKQVTRKGYSYDEAFNPVEYSWIETVPYHYYQRQLSEDAYEEIQVLGLEMKYDIWGSYSTTGNSDSEILLVPVDYSIVQDYPAAVRELLYARSLHFIFNSKVETKIKWYQTGFFKIILIGAAIVLTILDMGADGGGWIAAAMAATSVSAAAMIILESLILPYLIAALVVRTVFKFVVKKLGAKIGMILAVAAVVAAAYGYFSNDFTMPPWAQDMIQVANGLSKAVSDVTTDALLGLKKEAEAFGTEVESKMKLLEDANALLDNQVILSPFVIFGESPDDYYDRTVHSGNIGVMAYDYVSDYVDNAITLPKPYQTLELG